MPGNHRSRFLKPCSANSVFIECIEEHESKNENTDCHEIIHAYPPIVQDNGYMNSI